MIVVPTYNMILSPEASLYLPLDMLRRSALIILCPLTPELLSSLILLRNPEFIPSYGILSHKIFVNRKIKSTLFIN